MDEDGENQNMNNIKIIESIGASNNKALLCEIPQDLAEHIKINHNGEINALQMIKLLRQAYIKSAELNKKNNKKTHSLNQKDRENLYQKIFDRDLAIEPLKIQKISGKLGGSASWNS